MKSYNRIVALKKELMSHIPGSDEYQTILLKIKDMKGDWYINSPKHNFCFWSWQQENKDPKTLLECSLLLDLSISQVVNIEKQAINKLKAQLERSPQLAESLAHIFDINNNDDQDEQKIN